MEALINPTFLGNSGNSGVFRVSVAEAGLPLIQSITIEDDNLISGGSGGASGFDLDTIKLSTTLLSSPSQVATLTGISAFTFADSTVSFSPGFLQPWRSGENPVWNRSQLIGANGTAVDFPRITLAAIDGLDDAGFLSIGEGGRITFTLNSPISSSSLYLYVADSGGGNDGFRVRVSSEARPVFPPGLTLVGTITDDLIDLSQGVNAAIGQGNDSISGGGGNDKIFCGAGNDIANGEEGDDLLNGGVGNDQLNGGIGNDRMIGGAGRDRINPGSGNNRVTLGTGRDICEVIRGSGVTVMTDFRDRQDKIDLPTGVSFRQLDITQRGRRTVISLGADQLAVLLNVKASVITAADFI